MDELGPNWKGEEFWGTKSQFYQIKWWLKDGILKNYEGQNGQLAWERILECNDDMRDVLMIF